MKTSRNFQHRLIYEIQTIIMKFVLSINKENPFKRHVGTCCKIFLLADYARKPIYFVRENSNIYIRNSDQIEASKLFEYTHNCFYIECKYKKKIRSRSNNSFCLLKTDACPANEKRAIFYWSLISIFT